MLFDSDNKNKNIFGGKNENDSYRRDYQEYQRDVH